MSSIFNLFITLLFTYAHAATIEVVNNCPHTVWAAGVPVGGGKRLDSGQKWMINAPPGMKQARVWARTGCNFDASGKGKCQTGDCNGGLECKSFGVPPNTVAGYGLNQLNNQDAFYISLFDGFNVPMEFSPTSNGCTRGITCKADTIIRQCPNELKAPGGCNNPCTVFNTDKYCCNSGGNCGPTKFSRFFKDRCKDAYTYARDDLTSTFTCPSGTNYKVVFCP